MIPNLPQNTTYAVHLRAASSSGGKDWVGSITDSNEIHTYWGRTCHINQHSAKPGDFMALQKIISQKMNGKDKYIQFDEYHRQQGWQSQRKHSPQPVPPKVKPVSAPSVDWVEAPVNSINWDF